MSDSEHRRLISISNDRNNYNTYSIQTGNGNGRSTTSQEFRDTGSLQVFDKIFLLILIGILIVGLLIGMYLLLTEGHEWRQPGIYNLTYRELWQAREPSSAIPKLKLPTRNIVFLQTNSSSCANKHHCSKVILKLQHEHMQHQKQPDISYSFIVAEDGTIFEGRGWNFQTDDSSTGVTVAFLGTFVTPRQAESARIFVDVALAEGKLERCFNILVLGESGFFTDIARNIQDALSDCEGIT